MEIGGAKATDFFGSPEITSVFSAGAPTVATPSQEVARVTVNSQKQEINRIRGYKIRLTAADNKRLTEIQVQIQEITQKAAKGTARKDEFDDRTELLAEADAIIGKPTVDIEADDFLANLATGLQALLATKLSPTAATRVDQLQRVKDNIEGQLGNNPDSLTLRTQFTNVASKLNALTPPRSVSQLSNAERKAYDDLAVLINDHVGAKIQLSSKEALRVAQLESSITSLQGQLPADISQQPTPQDVSRAYTRIG